jgi:hypothetical protein
VTKVAASIAVVFLAVLVAGFFIFRAIRQDRAVYAPDDIEILASGTDAKGYTLIIREPTEAGYCCPGVRFGSYGAAIRFDRPAEDRSTTCHYEYVRSAIGRVEHVDIEAVSRKNGSLSITFPYLDGRWEKGDRIVEFDPEGNKRGSCECLGVPEPKSTDAKR